MENLLIKNKKLEILDSEYSVFFIMIKDAHSCMETIKLLDNFYDDININKNYYCDIIFHSYNNDIHSYNYKVLDCNYKISEFIIYIGVNKNENENGYGYILDMVRIYGDPFCIIQIFNKLKILLKNNNIHIKKDDFEYLSDDIENSSDDLENIDDFPNILDDIKLDILNLDNDPDIIKIWFDDLKSMYAIYTLYLLLKNYNTNYENNFKIINNGLLSNEGKNIIKYLTDIFLDSNNSDYILNYYIYLLLCKYFNYNKLYDEFKHFIEKYKYFKYINNKILKSEDNITIVFDKLYNNLSQ